jgi:nucleoside-diphosphate-sugar epimerase
MPSKSTPSVVFITGGSGHIGSRVIVDALKAGYYVRAAVRSSDKSAKILALPSIKAVNPGDNLQFVNVPDMMAPGAYDQAIQGVDYIIHIASPITSSYKEGDDMEKYFVDTAVEGTLQILTAAKKTPSIKRIVITSSVVAIVPWKDFSSGKCETIFDEKSRSPFIPGPYDNVFEAYSAGKTKALNDAEAWVEKEKPSFEVAYIFPGFVIGKDELVTDVKDAMYGTNKEVLNPVTGGDDGFIPGASVHLYDVALAHVKALDSKVPAQGYVLSSEGLRGTHWEEAMPIVAKNFAAEVKSGVLANNGKTVTLPVKIDERKSEEILGMKYLSYEEQVNNIVGHYLELVSASA